MIQKVCKLLDMSMPGLDKFMRLRAEAAEEAAVNTAIRGGTAAAIDSGGP
jgi:hypothetical protein